MGSFAIAVSGGGEVAVCRSGGCWFRGSDAGASEFWLSRRFHNVSGHLSKLLPGLCNHYRCHFGE